MAVDDMELPAVLFEDDRLLVLDKPPGRLVVAGRGEGQGEPLVDEASRAAGRKLLVTHRLDRDTSGVLVFAKDAATHRDLCALFERHAVQKAYLALAQGRLAGPRVMDQPLGPFGSGRWGVKAGAKPSRTALKPIEWFAGRGTLVEARPQTGRRHQVRVHLYAAGHPVLGDPLYGRPDDWSRRAPRLMLHAARLAFKLGGRRFEVCSPLPADFSSFMALLRSEGEGS